MNKELRLEIMKKANNRCTCSEEAKHIHHKDEDKKNNNMDNLIALCITCHKKAHRKKYAPGYFQKAKKYGKWLKETRKRMGITHADIYTATAIWMSKLSGIENGYLPATEEEKKKIAKVLKVAVNSIDWGE